MKVCECWTQDYAFIRIYSTHLYATTYNISDYEAHQKLKKFFDSTMDSYYALGHLVGEPERLLEIMEDFLKEDKDG